MSVPPEIIAEVMRDSPELRHRAEKMVANVFDHLEYQLTFGDHSTREQLAKSVLPSVIKSSQAAKESEQQNALINSFNEMTAMFEKMVRPDDDIGA